MVTRAMVVLGVEDVHLPGVTPALVAHHGVVHQLVAARLAGEEVVVERLDGAEMADEQHTVGMAHEQHMVETDHGLLMVAQLHTEEQHPTAVQQHMAEMMATARHTEVSIQEVARPAGEVRQAIPPRSLQVASLLPRLAHTMLRHPVRTQLLLLVVMGRIQRPRQVDRPWMLRRPAIILLQRLVILRVGDMEPRLRLHRRRVVGTSQRLHRVGRTQDMTRVTKV